MSFGRWRSIKAVSKTKRPGANSVGPSHLSLNLAPGVSRPEPEKVYAKRYIPTCNHQRISHIRYTPRGGHMPATYKDFHRQPSKPHQCMHTSEKDGTRCRAASM